MAAMAELLLLLLLSSITTTVMTTELRGKSTMLHPSIRIHVLHTRYVTASRTISPGLASTLPLTPPSSSWKEITALTERILYKSTMYTT